ncbi:helix-turn-helix domain-containing protein [Paenibacillus sp.]|uniref:helix-turn-helix domain-containing protein n=1 Tax=Paenibacillus sp. TaxID=58172 RepID=UPI0035C809CA
MKPRTRLGKWMDDNGVHQNWLEKKTGLSPNTVSELCNNKDYIPRTNTRSKVIRALREVDPGVSAGDFW